MSALPLKRLLSWAGALCGLVAPGAAAFGQDAAMPDSAMIVTARRTDEPALQVPISIMRLDSVELQRTGADRLSEVAGSVPNLAVPTLGVFGAEQPTIRGVFSPIGAATVGLYVDDVPVQIRSLEVAGNPDLRVFDLDRIEVLRGPQGTLFGASSMGGTIRYLTRQPMLEGEAAQASGEIAAVKGGGITRQAQGAAASALVPGKLGVRASAYYRRDAGVIDRIDPATGVRTDRNVDHGAVMALRLTAKAAVGERLELTPALFYQRGERADLPFFEDRLGRFRQSAVVRQPGRDRFILPSLTATLDLGGVMLTSVTAWLDRRNRQTVDYSGFFGEIVLGGLVPDLRTPGGSRSRTAVEQRSLTQEIRLSSNDPQARLKWVVGTFYRRSRLMMEQRVVEPGIAELTRDYLGLSVEELFGLPLLDGGASYDSRQRIREQDLALFGQAAWTPVPGVEATAGLRVSRSSLGFRLFSQGPFAGGTNRIGPDRQRDTPVIPYASLSYRPSETSLVYVSAGKGFRGGGTNGAVPAAACGADLSALGRSSAPDSYASDSLWSYEAGVKKGAPTDPVQLSLALFRIDWRDIQQSVALPNCGFSYVDNLGAARNQGFEMALTARPVPSLRLGASLGFVDARFRRDVGAPLADGAGSIVARGDRVPYVPRWSGSVSAEYRFDLPKHVGGFVRSEWRYAGAYRRAPSTRSAAYDPRIYAGEASDMLMLRVGAGRGPWEVTAFVDNLLDARALLYRNVELAPATGSPIRQMAQRPRTIGLTGRLGF